MKNYKMKKKKNFFSLFFIISSFEDPTSFIFHFQSMYYILILNVEILRRLYKNYKKNSANKKLLMLLIYY